MRDRLFLFVALLVGLLSASGAEIIRRAGAIPGISDFKYQQGVEKIQLTQEFSKAGTITMWLRPDGWDNQDKAWHFFMTAGTVGRETPYINFMRQVDGRSRFVYCLNASENKVADLFATIPFVKDQWIHLAISWQVLAPKGTHTRMRLYVNGKQVGQRIFPFVMGDKLPTDLVVGDQIRWKPYSAFKSTLGRVECHPAELSADAISSLAQQKMVKDKLTIRNLQLTPGSKGNSFTGKIEAPVPQSCTMEVSFLDEVGTATNRSIPLVTDSNGFFRFALDTPDNTLSTTFCVLTSAEKSPVWGFTKIDYAPWLPAVEPHFWQGSWIWLGNITAPEAHRYFVRTFHINPNDFSQAAFQWASDDRAEVFLNGKSIGRISSWAIPKVNDQLKALLVPGTNVLAVDAYNVGGSAGFFGELSLVKPDGAVTHIATDNTWKASEQLVLGWNQPGFDASGWHNAEVIMRPPQTPYGETPYRDFAPQQTLTATAGGVIKFSGRKLTVASSYRLPQGVAPGKVSLVLYRKGKELFRKVAQTECRQGELHIQAEVAFPEVLLDERYTAKWECRGMIFSQHPGEVHVKMSSAPEKLVARVEQINGVPRLTINGKPTPLTLYRTPINFRNSTSSYQYITDFDQIGVRLSEINLSFQQLMLPGGKLNTDELELYLQAAMLYAPNSRFMLFFQTDAPKWFVSQHPEELYRNSKQQLNQVSYASEKWKADSCAFLQTAIEYIKTRPYYARIAGFGFDGGEDGQFMQWTGRNLNYLGDYSPAMKRYFHRKLQAKYGNIATLNQAWKHSYGAFEEIEIPSVERRMGSTSKLFLDPVADADITEFHRCFADCVVDVLLAYAKIAKAATEGTRITAAYYGKFFSIAGYLEWGELAIERVLRSPELDYLVAVEYNMRGSGSPHSVSAPLASYALHNKIFVDEADLRTFLSGSKTWAYTGTAFETTSVIRKMFIFNHVKGHGIHWYDLHGNVFASPAILTSIRNVQKIAEERITTPLKPAQIAVIVDEPSFLHTTVAMKKVSARALLHIQNGNFGRMGADFDLYFTSDLKHPKFPDYKMYVFMNLWAPSKEIAATVDKLKGDGKTLVFLFNSGIIQGNTLAVNNVSRMTGITMAEGGAKNLSMVVEPAKAPAFLKNAIAEPQYCSAAASDRTAIPVDTKAQLFGRFLNDNSSHFPCAIKKFPTWTSVYSAVPFLTPAIWRELARQAGVHIYTDDPGTMLYFGNGVLGIHVAAGGTTPIRWPAKATFVDAVTGAVYGKNTDLLQLEMLPNETKILIVK